MADNLNTELEIVKFMVDDIVATSPPGLNEGGNFDPNNPGNENVFPG